MIGLDTNILARYYIDDQPDATTLQQRQVARRLIDSGQQLKVCKTVLLEFEWVMRGYYKFERVQVTSVLRHLLSLQNVMLEDRSSVEQALLWSEAGFDFADVLHHASYGDCQSMAIFDDRRFSRRAQKFSLLPVVHIPV